MNIPKFRAWDKETEKVLRVHAIFFDEGGSILDLLCIMESEYLVRRDIKQVELMQSTGLKDKNGAEIFEGDVVKIEKNICKVEFEEQGVRYVLKNINSERNHLYFNKQSFERCKVIGNIYENPELLEGVKQ